MVLNHFLDYYVFTTTQNMINEKLPIQYGAGKWWKLFKFIVLKIVY